LAEKKFAKAASLHVSHVCHVDLMMSL